MLKRKRTSAGVSFPKPRIVIYEDILESIFDECDRYEVDETGGRLIGFYRRSRRKLVITVSGLIESGPDAWRTRGSLFQNGAYQESVFREFEDKYPRIEHLGNWHTHHVNALDTLSDGDIETYSRIVNHQNHNTDFFYALLITARSEGRKTARRYSLKHFMLHRGIAGVWPIPASQVRIVKKPPLRIAKRRAPSSEGKPRPCIDATGQPADIQVRTDDTRTLSEMCPDVRPFLSKTLGSLFWRGEIDLVDDSSVEVLVLESIECGTPFYSIALTAPSAKLFRSSQQYADKKFESATKAIWFFERHLNRELFGEAES